MKVVFLLLSLLSSIAFAGGMVGNGGDAVLQEFNLRGLQLAAYFKVESAVATKYSVDAAKFLDVVKKTQLEGQDHLFLGSAEVDAINHPSEFRIEVSRTRWGLSANRSDAYFVQRRIALHEYLWVYGIDDTGYAVSNPIIAELEKAAVQVLDPDVRDILYGKLCATLRWDNNYAATIRLLSWGLDLNTACAGPAVAGRTPLTLLLGKKSDVSYSDQYLVLLRSMLEYGADPNGTVWQNSYCPGCFEGWLPLIVTALTDDHSVDNDKITDMLFEFGADPNRLLMRYGTSTFAVAAGQGIGKFYKMDAITFTKFINAGGDVNLSQSNSGNYSAARAIVQKEDNADVVEALIKTGKTDWCTISVAGANSSDDAQRVTPTRVIDVTRPEYQALIKKYGITCGRYAAVYGKAQTCEGAQAQARKQCVDQGYRHNGQIPPFMITEKCDDGGTINGIQLDYTAGFICTDD
jgi:hypothetical protein